MGGVFAPQVAPSSKLYSDLKPVTAVGAVTVNVPQPALTLGAVGESGKITTFTGSAAQAAGEAAPSATMFISAAPPKLPDFT